LDTEVVGQPLDILAVLIESGPSVEIDQQIGRTPTD
jgi:hypothetical protein